MGEVPPPGGGEDREHRDDPHQPQPLPQGALPAQGPPQPNYIFLLNPNLTSLFVKPIPPGPENNKKMGLC